MALEFLGWLRWTFYFGWKEIFLCMWAYSKQQRELTGHSGFAQFCFLCRYSIGWCISPASIYHFGLFTQGAEPLSYVFTPEVAGFHKIKNAGHTGQQQELDLLADKTKFAQVAANKGAPTVATLLAQPRTKEPPFLEDIMPTNGEGVFCKLRKASSGKGSFSVTQTAAGLSGQKLNGTALADRAAIQAAWERMCHHGDAIVQPLLQNHPSLAASSPDGPVFTIRVITRHKAHKGGIAGAFLECLATDQNALPNNYVFFPVDILTGAICKQPVSGSVASNIVEEAFDPCFPKVLPYWDEIRRICLKLHTEEFTLWSIAWDWCVTPEGPVLLEGNSSWDTSTLQQYSQEGLLKYNS